MPATRFRQNFVNRPDSGLAIELSGLSKTYRGSLGKPSHLALDHVDLQVPAGCIFGLLGPNGAGKSTLINILAGTVIKTSGMAIVWGTDIDENPRQARANIGIVPQELNVDAFFTPRQTIDLMAGLYGVPKAERQTNAILDMVGLAEQADMYARRLSGGMRRRLLVGKAMVHQPPVLILDEPTAGVDVALRQRLWDNIKTLNGAGVTVVLTTHYLEEAEELCDRIAIINHGELIADKPTRDLVGMAREKIIRLEVDKDLAGPPMDEAFTRAEVTAPRTLEVTYDRDKMTAGQVLTIVQGHGYAIEDVSTLEPDLEDVFVQLTGAG